MRLSKIVMSSAFAVAVLALASTGFSDDAPTTPAPAATGSVSGTVKGVDGKPVAGVTVRVVTLDANKPKSTAADGDTKKKPMANAVATATTDDQGAFKMDAVPAGSYNINANKSGLGHAKAALTVKAGENVSIDLQLTAAKKKTS